MRQFARVVARNSALGMAAQIAIKLLSFGFSLGVVRHLGAREFGQYASILAFGALFAFLADLGLSPYAVREMARLREVAHDPLALDRLFTNVLALRLLLSCATVTALVATAWLTRRPPPVIVAIALNGLGLVVYGIQGACDATLSGHERVDLVSRATVINQAT